MIHLAEHDDTNLSSQYSGGRSKRARTIQCFKNKQNQKTPLIILLLKEASIVLAVQEMQNERDVEFHTSKMAERKQPCPRDLYTVL